MRDTRRLTQCEHGAYFLLLNEYYLTGEPLPDNDRLLAKISLCDTLGDWLAIRPAIESHFEIRDGHWFHHRCERELRKSIDATNAMKRGAAMTNKKRWGSPSDTQAESPCGQQPEPYLIKSKTLKVKDSSSPNSGEDVGDSKKQGVHGNGKPILSLELENWFVTIFYPEFPRKRDPDDARRAIKAINPTVEERNRIMAALSQYKKLEWRNRPPDKIPYPASWLHSGGWKDEDFEDSGVARELNYGD